MSKRQRHRNPPLDRIPQAVALANLRRSAARGTSEQAAARALQVERDRRAGECLTELLELLRRHGCGLQVVVQDIMNPGQPGSDRRCQVNVVALEAPASERPGPASSSSSDNGGKPA